MSSARRLVYLAQPTNSHTASYDAPMANIDTLDLSEPTSKAEGANSAQEGKGVEGSSDKGVDEVAGQVSKSASPTRDASPALSSPGSGLVPLRGTPLNGSTPPANNAPTISMPHPKKFSHVDINKRFLGKNSATSSTSQTPSASGVSKPGSAIRMYIAALLAPDLLRH